MWLLCQEKICPHLYRITFRLAGKVLCHKVGKGNCCTFCDVNLEHRYCVTLFVFVIA